MQHCRVQSTLSSVPFISLFPSLLTTFLFNTFPYCLCFLFISYPVVTSLFSYVAPSFISATCLWHMPFSPHGVCQVTARRREEEVTVVYCAHCAQWCSSVQWQAAECSAWRDTVKVTAADGKTLQRGTLFYFTCPYLCATAARTAHDNVLKVVPHIYLRLKHILGSCRGVHTFSTMHQGKVFLPFPRCTLLPLIHLSFPCFSLSAQYLTPSSCHLYN